MEIFHSEYLSDAVQMYNNSMQETAQAYYSVWSRARRRASTPDTTHGGECFHAVIVLLYNITLSRRAHVGESVPAKLLAQALARTISSVRKSSSNVAHATAADAEDVIKHTVPRVERGAPIIYSLVGVCVYTRCSCVKELAVYFLNGERCVEPLRRQ